MLMRMNFFVYNSVKIKKYFLLFCKMSDCLITGKKIQEKLKHYLNLDVSESRCLYYRLRSRSRSRYEMSRYGTVRHGTERKIHGHAPRTKLSLYVIFSFFLEKFHIYCKSCSFFSILNSIHNRHDATTLQRYNDTSI